jgi:hypothetical protein
MKPSSPGELLATFAVLGLLGYLVTKVLYATLPPLPTPAGVTLLVLAAIEAGLAYVLKARIERKPGTRPVEPLMAARAVALAKASALAGAVMAGLWAGFLCFVLARRTELAAAEADTPGAVLGLLCALALVAAALWLEHSCRTPPDADEQDPHQQR